MVHKTIKTILLLTILFSTGLLTRSCYYDNVESLGGNLNCDTTKITYNLTIYPMIKNNCTICHKGSTAGGNVKLTTIYEIRDAIQSGKLLGSVKHQPGFSPMPKGGNKLSDCDIRKLELWVKQGMKNN